MTKTIKQTVEPEALFALLNRPGAHIVTITADTQVKMNKGGNPYYGARKISQVNGLINWRYENAVNNQREREGAARDFEAEPRTWGQRLEGQPWVAHKGQYYLELKVQRSLSTTYYLDDKLVGEDEIKPYLPKREEGGRQDVEKPVILRDYRLDSICGIKFDGVLYTVKHSVKLPRVAKLKFDELVTG